MAFNRGTQRKQGSAARTIAKVAVAGIIAGAPLGLAVGTASAAPSMDWDAVAKCESGNNWSINTGNGYYGGLQFSMQTWRGHGGQGNPAAASREEQIRIAERVLQSQGPQAWPTCGAKGLGGQTAPARKAAPAPQQQQQRKVQPQQRQAAAPVAPVVVAGSKTNPNGTYEIKAGDTLSKIADEQKVVGGWQAIVEKNKEFLTNPNLIFPGHKLAL